jgi:oxalate decarboxylase
MNDMTIAQPINGSVAQPINGSRGATVAGPRNIPLEAQVPDIFSPPLTDKGSIPNLHFPFAYAHNRLEDGGWAREVTVREMPALKSMAIVNMRLGPGVARELHWHKEAEWAYITAGKARLTVVDADRYVSVDDLEPGDMWLVPSGVPHSIQGLEEGTEFVLVFDDGNFSENQTLLITEMMAHLPKSVIAKNFGLAESAFNSLPKEEKYIFRLPVPPALDVVRKQLPDNPPPQSYVCHASKIAPNKFDGGSTKVIDHRQFPETSLSALIIDLEPGALREIHWHPDADELQYYVKGEARMTVFDAVHNARTFNYRAGDVGYVPKTLGHYIENTGTEPMRVINVFNSRRYSDVSLNQWMALTPPDMVRGTLNLDDGVMKALRREFRPVVR